MFVHIHVLILKKKYWKNKANSRKKLYYKKIKQWKGKEQIPENSKQMEIKKKYYSIKSRWHNHTEHNYQNLY